MTDGSSIAPPKADDGEHPIQLSYGRLDCNAIVRNIFDMSPIAAEVAKEQTRLQYAVPAIQNTWRVVVVSAAALIACALVYQNPAAGWPIAAIMSIFGGASIAPSIVEMFRKRG